MYQTCIPVSIVYLLPPEVKHAKINLVSEQETSIVTPEAENPSLREKIWGWLEAAEQRLTQESENAQRDIINTDSFSDKMWHLWQKKGIDVLVRVVSAPGRLKEFITQKFASTKEENRGNENE